MSSQQSDIMNGPGNYQLRLLFNKYMFILFILHKNIYLRKRQKNILHKYYVTGKNLYFIKKFYMVLSHSPPVPPLRTMFSNKVFCCIFLVLVSIVCRQALGGQKYLIKTGKKSPSKHLLVETEDYDPEEYDSVKGKIYCLLFICK